MAYQEHQQSARSVVAFCAIVTLSDTRTVDTDTSGKAIRTLLEQANHRVVDYRLIKDEPDQLRAALDSLLKRDDVHAIISNGGTGVSRRDQTIGVIDDILDVPLPGFGELFRMLSYEQIGAGAMLSRATAGIARGKVVFAVPGSTKAVELAMTKLILPELGHILREVNK